MKRQNQQLVLEGIVKRHPDGFGFFIPDHGRHPDVYIPRGEMGSVMSNDRVRVRIVPEPGGDRFRGEGLHVISRSISQVIGRYQYAVGGNGILVDESHAWGANLHIRLDKSMGAKAGDWVAARVLTYPDEKAQSHFTGEVIAIIQNIEDPLNDIKRVLFGHNIPHEFPKDVLAEAERLPHEVEPQHFAGRKDLRHLDLITIDGVTAKDFDDAIYVENDHRGFRLWVAIADVSHYVRPGSAIDREAYIRGTSVYFPNFVVPMLPEQLSNELCSLKPKVPRLALVAEMHFDFQGVMTSSNFYEAVIESKARVTYGEAQECIEGRTPEKIKHVEQAVLRAEDLAKILMAKRFREGSLDLEIPETEIEIDEAGNVVDIIKSKRLFSHRLIEELMLAANVAVALFFTESQVPALYRIHDSPNGDSLKILGNFLYNFGSRVKLTGNKIQTRLTKALEAFHNKPEGTVLNILTLRSMAQAKYSAQNIGHFGLGFSDYTHFTSPIRRYPDLIVHRLLKSLIMPGRGYQGMASEELDTAGTMLSACEQRSVKAERQFQSIKRARFMFQHLGQEFDGVISSVVKFGVFVSLTQFDVDGLVKVEELGQEFFEFDAETLMLKGKKSGTTYQIGDPIRIRVAATDTEAGQIDFVLADRPATKKAAGAPQVSNRHPRREGSGPAAGRGGRLQIKSSHQGRAKRDDERPSEKKSGPQKKETHFKRGKKQKSQKKRGRR